MTLYVLRNSLLGVGKRPKGNGTGFKILVEEVNVVMFERYKKFYLLKEICNELIEGSSKHIPVYLLVINLKRYYGGVREELWWYIYA